MGKAFNEARLDRIAATARHNDRNRLGCIHGRPDRQLSSRYHNDINLETHQLGGKLGESIKLSLRVSVLDDDALFFCVTMLAQPLPDSLGAGNVSSWVGPR